MNGKQLKNSILQLAIQGKLVPQDPNDEPASELLKRIRAEKEQLVKGGKLKKKDLVTTPISDEEKPFEVPEGWEWCRLGELFLHTSGKQQSSSNKKEGKLNKFITTSNLYWGRFDLDVVKEMNFTEEEVKTCSATKGDLLVCEGGAGYGRSAIWPYDYDICLQNHVHRLRPLVNGTCDYVYHFIYLLKETNQLQSVGTAMPGLSANRLKGLVLPLPPLAEQHRIVAKIEELMPLVEEYDKAQTKLDDLNRKLPEALKKSILQEAIMGKLVAQDPNDEPASELLKRIRAEKERLVKGGKLKKKDLVTTPISDEEKPFEVPEGWEWVRFCEVFAVFNGDRGKNYPSKDKLHTDGIPFISALNLNNNTVIKDEKLLCLSEEQYDKLNGGKLEKGDNVICIRGSLGKHGVFPFERGAIASSLVIAKNLASSVIPGILDMYLDSPLFFDQIKLYNNGTAQPNLAAKSLENFLFPLPPLSEQHRIVAKIEQLFSQIEGMK